MLSTATEGRSSFCNSKPSLESIPRLGSDRLQAGYSLRSPFGPHCVRYSAALRSYSYRERLREKKRQCHQHGSFPVRVSRGTEGSGGVEQKTCLSGASLFCVRQIVGTGVCPRSGPNGVGVRGRKRGFAKHVLPAGAPFPYRGMAGTPEGEPVPPLGQSGEDKHLYRCDETSAGVMSARREPPPPQVRTSSS